MFSDYDSYDIIEDKRVVLLQSGGLDSNICAAIMKHYGFEIHHVFIDYGQNSIDQERKMVHDIVNHYGGELHECKIHLPWLSDNSTLVGSEVNDWESEGTFNTSNTGVYVPMRNLMLLSIASSLAESLQISYICAALDGSQDTDGIPTGGTTDKHPDFVKKFEDTAINCSELYYLHGKMFTILTPLMDRYKSEIVKIGDKFHADMSLSWSCYNKGDKPCCKCSACKCRAQGFYYAGLNDPLLEKHGLHIDPKDIIIPELGPNPIDIKV